MEPLLDYDEDDDRQSWEREYERSWEVLEEDETGALRITGLEKQMREKR